MCKHSQILYLDIPKYWTMPRFPRGQIAYNYDRAVKAKIAVIVEGPTDVWRVGANAMACMGVSMGPLLRRRFIRDRNRLLGEQGFVIIMLDPPKRGQKPAAYMRKLALDFAPAFPRRLVTVELPVGTDPGSLDHDRLWRLIGKAARQQKVKLPAPLKFVEELG
jgi:hypothetical protein